MGQADRSHGAVIDGVIEDSRISAKNVQGTGQQGRHSQWNQFTETQ